MKVGAALEREAIRKQRVPEGPFIRIDYQSSISHSRVIDVLFFIAMLRFLFSGLVMLAVYQPMNNLREVPMSNWILCSVPLGAIALIVIYGGFAWKSVRKRTFPGEDDRLAVLPKEDQEAIQQHNDRIYKDFEMYLTVMLALCAGAGYIRLGKFEGKDIASANQVLLALGLISIFIMVVFCLFVILHQRSKLKRWKKIAWEDSIFFWQEILAIVSMLFFSSLFWIFAVKWSQL